MEAVARDPSTCPGEHRVRRRRTVGTDDVDRVGNAGTCLDRVQEVEQPRSDGYDVAGAPVANELVALRQNVRGVPAVRPIFRCQMFRAVGIVEVQGASAAGGCEELAGCRRNADGQGRTCLQKSSTVEQGRSPSYLATWSPPGSAAAGSTTIKPFQAKITHGPWPLTWLWKHRNRKSVVLGKRVSVREDLGGGLI